MDPLGREARQGDSLPARAAREAGPFLTAWVGETPAPGPRRFLPGPAPRRPRPHKPRPLRLRPLPPTPLSPAHAGPAPPFALLPDGSERGKRQIFRLLRPLLAHRGQEMEQQEI